MLASGVIHQAYCQPNNQAKAVTPHHATDSRGLRIPAKLTNESDDDDRVESRGAWGLDSNVVGHHGG